MAITKSYNKRMKTHYVYDTEYVWSEEKQKKVQKRRCIGKLDETTGKIIPTGPKGRHSTNKTNLADSSTTSDMVLATSQLTDLLDYTSSEIDIIKGALSDLSQKYIEVSVLLKKFEANRLNGDKDE